MTKVRMKNFQLIESRNFQITLILCNMRATLMTGKIKMVKNILQFNISKPQMMVLKIFMPPKMVMNIFQTMLVVNFLTILKMIIVRIVFLLMMMEILVQRMMKWWRCCQQILYLGVGLDLFISIQDVLVIQGVE